MNQVVKFQATAKPAMPTVDKHRRALAPFVDANGGVQIADVHAATQLIPIADLTAIIGELESALSLCSDATALVFAKQLIGQYRIKDVVDPKTYINGVAAKFQKFPPDICAKIIDVVTDRLKFPPAPADVVEAGQQFLREREAVLRSARQHAAEYERRRAEAEEAEQRQGQWARREADLKAEYEMLGWEWPGYDKASIIKVILARGKEGN